MTKEPENQIYIGCMTVQMGLWNPTAVADGSIVKQCGTCGSDIHLSLSSQKFIEEKPQAHLICIPCIQKNTIEEKAKAHGEKVVFEGAVPGAIEEALKHIFKKKDE